MLDFVRSGHQHCVAVCGVPFLNNIVLFLPVGLLFIKKRSLPALGPRSLFFHRVPLCPVTERLAKVLNKQKYRTQGNPQIHTIN